MAGYRMVRLGEQIREEISTMIMKEQIKDPRVSTFLSVNLVDVSADLGYAKVYISSFMKDKSIQKGVEGLQSAAGFIQHALGKKLTIRKIPKLTFIADSSVKEGFEMVNKLNELEREQDEREKNSPLVDES